MTNRIQSHKPTPAESGLQLLTRPKWFMITMPSNIQMRMASNVTTEMVSMDSLVLKMGFSRIAIGCVVPM